MKTEQLKNYLNIESHKIDSPIYRVFSIARLFEIFNTSQLTLVKPELWDDPFENFISKFTTISADGDKHTWASREWFYGQCWSLHKESDAMWRIYSPKKDGVKVKTTIRKLYEMLSRCINVDATDTLYIGKVQYKPERKLIDAFHDEKMSPFGWVGGARALLLKRLEFKHESEVRVIYYNHDTEYNNPTFKIDIDPFELFEEIIFDPRMDTSSINNTAQKLIELGFKNRMAQSTMYKIPNFTISI